MLLDPGVMDSNLPFECTLRTNSCPLLYMPKYNIYSLARKKISVEGCSYEYLYKDSDT